MQKKAAEKQKVDVEKSVQKKATQKQATSPIAGKKCKPATSQASPTAGKKWKPATSTTTSEGTWETIPCQSKEKPVDRYADDGGAAGTVRG